eukprot:5709433-Pleurochrysis_carterae.AAC.3
MPTGTGTSPVVFPRPPSPRQPPVRVPATRLGSGAMRSRIPTPLPALFVRGARIVDRAGSSQRP